MKGVVDSTVLPNSDASAARLSWKLVGLVRRYQDLSREGWRSNEPQPTPWARLASDIMEFRTQIPERTGNLYAVARACQTFADARLDLERKPPKHIRRKRLDLDNVWGETICRLLEEGTSCPR